MNVIGLDLSLTKPGLAWGNRLSDMVTIDHAREHVYKDARLNRTRDVLRHILKNVPIDLAVIEGPAFAGSLMFQVGLVQGVVRLVLNDFAIPYAVISPTAVKAFATGSGSADKTQMIAGVTAVTGVVPGDDNQADAWWLRSMGLAALGVPNVELTDARSRRIAACEWPPPVSPWAGYVHELKAPPKLCSHKMFAIRNAGRWVHAFSLSVCDKPVKVKRSGKDE